MSSSDQRCDSDTNPTTPLPPDQDHEKALHSSDTENTENTKNTEKPNSSEIKKTNEQEQPDTSYPGPLRLTLITVSANLALFLVGLDNTILSTAIPRITDRFDALSDVGWYASAYLLTNCAFQLMWGKLYSFYAVPWVYLAALVLFEAGSLLCAAAPSSTALIVGRAMAGLGGGGVGSGSFVLIAHAVPAPRRPMLIGLMGAMYGFSAIAGPLLGGAFTDHPRLTWRWCFYINLPLGAVTATVILFCVGRSVGQMAVDQQGRHKMPLQKQLRQMDIPGTLVLLAAVVCLLLALQWGGTRYAWNNGRILTLLVLTVVLLSAFVVVQHVSGDRATVPGRIFGNRNVWGSALFGSGVVASFFLILYYLPFWFQAIQGVTPTTSAVHNLPMLISYVLFSISGGFLTSIVGYAVPFAYATVVLMAIGSGLLTLLRVDSRAAAWIGYQILFGAGIGLGLQTAFAAPQCVLPLADMGIGTSIVLFSENLSSAVFVSVAQNVFTNQLKTNIAATTGTGAGFGFGLDVQAILDGGATSLRASVPAALYDVVLRAYNKSLTQTYYVAVALACISVVGVLAMEWVSVKRNKQKSRKVEKKKVVL